MLPTLGIFAAIFNAFALVLHTIADAGKGVVHFIEGTLGFAIRTFFPPLSPSKTSEKLLSRY